MSLITFIILLLLFEGSLEKFIPQIKYMDEMLVLLFFVKAIFKILKAKKIELNKKEAFVVFFIFIYFFIGILSNTKSGILIYKFQYLLSGILSMKFIFMFLFGRICFKNIKINYNCLNRLYIILNVILTCYTIIILLNVPFKFLNNWGIRYSIIRTVSAGFSHPNQLDFLGISIMIIQFFLIMILNKNISYYKIICIKSFILILFSGRTKAMVFFILYICVVFFARWIKKISIKQVILVMPFALFLANSRIQSEFINNGARGMLYKVAFKIANDFFPLGSGFGTYGSEISRKFYSSLYYIYGLSNIHGLSPERTAYITDAQWASILGESGWIGLIIYLIITIVLTYVIINYTKKVSLKIAISGLWIYGLISSISDTIFITYRGIIIALVVSLFMSVTDVIQKEREIIRH